MNRRRTPIAAALLVAFAAPLTFSQFASAQSATPETTLPAVKVQDQSIKDDYAPAKTTIGGKAPTLLRDVPQSITVINRAVLDSQAATSITDALRNVPGITISAGEGGVIGDNINLRGFTARTDIFLDGVRDRGQYSRDTFFLESVEVLKGPSSMLFGRGSTGGVINQVSKKPDLKARSEVSASVGTDDYYRTTLDLNRPLSDTSAFRVSALVHDADSTRDVTETKRYGIAPSLRLGIGTPTEITLSVLVQRNRDIPDYGFPLFWGKPISAPANNFYGFTDDKFDQDINVFNATIEHKFNNNLTLRNQTQYGKYKTEAAPTPLSSVTSPASTALELVNVPRNTRDRELDDSSLFNQTDLIAKFQAGTMLHTVISGIEIGRDKNKNDAYTWTGLGTVNLGNPVYSAKPSTAVRSHTTVTNVTADTLGIYVNDLIDLTKQWKLVGGLRWDRFDADYKQESLTTVTAPTVLSRDDKMLSTRAGVIWQPSDTESYYVSYGTSFNPSAETLTLSTSNADVKPEKNRSIEVGAKMDLLNGNLMFNTALFRVEKTNARTTDPLTAVVSLDGDIRVNGIEFGAVGRITKAWQVIAGYTFLNGEIIKSSDVSSSTVSSTNPVAGVAAQGKTPQNTPQHTASLWSTYKITPAWETGGGMIYSSKRYVNNFETAVIDGYTRFDATLAYLQKSYDVRLNLLNLTDKEYFETASGARATPAKGRSAIVTVSYRF
ncbi:MAG: TonB-dependent siderophore receptor [Pseudomonadota bacterium]